MRGIWQRTITILGGPNSDAGDLSQQSLDRVQCALELWRKEPTVEFILTGGVGEYFNRTAWPHTHYVKNHLVNSGVPAEQIIAELPSKSTIEDIQMLYAELATREALDGKHSIVTSSFHVERVELLVRKTFKDTRPPMVVGAEDSIDKAALDKLRAHEKVAIEKLKQS